VSHKLTDGVFLAALPCKDTDKVLALVKEAYPCFIPAKNILQTTLQNANPVIHPAVSLLNIGLIERTKGDFLFYAEGITASVGRVMEAVDKERIAVGKELGVEVVPDPVMGVRQGYMQDAIYGKGYSEGIGFQGSRAPSNLDGRYIHEDVGYGLLFVSELGKSLGIETKVIDGIIDIFSVVMDRDYRAEKKRTMQTLGLAKYSLDELEKIL
jgi:opine dehydrogenase